MFACLLGLILAGAGIHLGDSGWSGDWRPGFLAKTEPATPADESAILPDSSLEAHSTHPGTDRPRPLSDRETKPDRPRDAALAGEPEVDSAPGQADDHGNGTEDEEGAPIHGSVLDDGGEPLPGRVVTAERLGPGSGSISGALQTRAVTDRLGMFSFESMPNDEYLLEVAEDEEFNAGRLRVRAGVNAAEIYLQRKGSIEVYGQVQDEMHRPLAEVTVRSLGSRQTVITDESGHYRIELERIKAGTAPVLEFRHVDHQEFRKRIEEIFGNDSGAVNLDVVMLDRSDTVSLSGWVSGPTHEPVAGALVWLSSSSPHANHRTRTDAFGVYDFQQIESGDHYRLGVEPEGSEYRRYVSKPQQIGTDHVTHDVRLERVGTAEISGVLVDPQGRPLPGFGIWLRQLEAGAAAPTLIQTDQLGQFASVEVRSGSLRLETHSSPYLEAGGIQLAAGESRFMQIPLDWGSAWLTGQVVDETDQPVQQAQIVVQWRASEFDVISKSRRVVRVDQSGFFSFANLGAEHYQMTVSAPGFQTRRIQVSPDLGGEMLITLISQSSSAGGGP